jgi:hypothetical protein
MSEPATAPRLVLWRRVAAFIAALPLGLRLVLVVAAVLHGVGLSWGMPGSDAWDNDGVAPRDFLPGLVDTFTPGKFYTYPPLHLALLGLLTLPVTVLATVRAGTTAVASVMTVILEPPYMTAMAMTARIVSLLMSLAIIVTLAKAAEEIVPSERRRGVAIGVAAFATVNVSFDYYAHMSNLDVPYLFWASLAVLALVRAIARREPRRIRHVAIFGALAITTKDQAYALFLFGVPAALALWFALDSWARANAKRVLLEAAAALVIAGSIVAVVDGAVTNPSGFSARVRFLTGSASQDYATYSRDAAGRWYALADVALVWDKHYPPALAAFLAIGLVDSFVTARREGRSATAAALVPLAVALSFTLCFNLLARRVEERFTLPQMLLAAIYAGIGLDRVWTRLRKGGPVVRWGARAACALAFAVAAWRCITLDANLLLEPRYDAEDYLASHARPGDTIEVHGLNVYLPRFRPGMKVVRVGPSAPGRRSPLPEVVEVQGSLGAIAQRNPHWVVVSECYVWRYLQRDLTADTGRIVPTVQKSDAHDADATAFFQGLWGGRLGYHVAHEARVTSHVFRRVELHASVGCPIFVFERNATAPAP